MNAALNRYRVMAYIVGVGLLTLVFVAMPMKYIGHDATLVKTVGPIHGFLYMAYLVVALDLAMRARWSPRKTLAVLIAGTIPFLSFVAERRISRELREDARV